MTQKDITFIQGKTFKTLVFWEAEPMCYRPITGITKSAPVVVTAPGHGLVDGWAATVVSAVGMKEINALKSPPEVGEYHPVRVVDADRVEINDINSSAFTEYVSGGYLQFYSAVDLVGKVFRMSVKNKVGGTEYLRLTSENGGIIVNLVTKTITIYVSATDTAGFTWKRGVYEVEAEDTLGVVTQILYGDVCVERELVT